MYKIPLILLAFITFGGSTTASIGRFLPFSGFYPIPHKTLGPIDIQVNRVKNITTFPLVLFVNGFEKASVKNTGYSVEIFLDQATTSNMITGGVLYNNLYVFRKIRFYWAGSPDGVAASTVNGKNGTPLEAYVYYYNQKYGSFRNALKYRDGLVELTFRISVVGSIPNPAFVPLAASLKQIREAGCTTKLSIHNASLYFIHFPPTTNYFAYPGGYANESTGELRYCSIAIVTSLNPTHFISKQQFLETFLSLRDYKGNPLINQVPQAPRGRRPVVQSADILKIPNFIKVSSRIGQL